MLLKTKDELCHKIDDLGCVRLAYGKKRFDSRLRQTQIIKTGSKPSTGNSSVTDVSARVLGDGH